MILGAEVEVRRIAVAFGEKLPASVVVGLKAIVIAYFLTQLPVSPNITSLPPTINM